MSRDPNLHPQARALLQSIDDSGAPSWNEMDIEAARATFVQGCKATAGEPVAVPHVQDLVLSLPGRDIAARLYRATDDTDQPLVIHYHGGGFVLGDLESHDCLCRKLCHQSGAAVLAVDYRLAPEHPFPAATDDAYDAVVWVRQNADRLGIDGANIILSGDSAGANIATVACRRLRDDNRPPVQGQILMYPTTDTHTDTPSYRRLATGYRLTRELMEWFLDLYLPTAADRDHVNAAPLKVDDLTGLPATLLFTAGFDPLCDEGTTYGQRLEQAGTAVTHHHYPTTIHAFCNMGGVLDDGEDAVKKTSLWIQGITGAGVSA